MCKTSSKVRFLQLRTHAIAEQLSSTSKQLMPESLKLPGRHSRKVKSYTLQPRGFPPAPDVRSLLYFIQSCNTVANVDNDVGQEEC